jgi:biotin carboxylase
MKTVLVLGASVLQLPAILTAKRLGLRVVVADENPQAVGMSCGDVAEAMDIRDPEQCLKLACRERVQAVVVVCTEAPLAAMAHVNEDLNLAGLRPSQVEVATDKRLMREALERHGVPSPRSIACRSVSAAHAAADELGFPVIVKPPASTGSRGVCQAEGRADLEFAYRHAEKFSTDGELVVEELVDGPEVSVESLTWRGGTEVIAITDKLTSGPPFWVEVGHTQPTTHALEVQSRIAAVARQGIAALGLDWCAAHTEVKITTQGPKIIEIGGRLGGDFIATELTPRSTGVDMVEGAILIALGLEPDIKPRHEQRASAIRYLIPRPGRMIAVSNVDGAKAILGVKQIEFAFRPGELIPAVKSSHDRAGWVIAEHETPDGAVAVCDLATQRMEILTSQGPEEI